MWNIYTMSSGDVDYLHIRLKEELGRLSLSMANAARLIGDKDSQGIRDACSGRKRVSAELVAKLGAIGVDAHYVLTGQRDEAHQVSDSVRPYGLSADEDALLKAYRRSTPEARAIVLRALDVPVPETPAKHRVPAAGGPVAPVSAGSLPGRHRKRTPDENAQ